MRWKKILILKENNISRNPDSCRSRIITNKSFVISAVPHKCTFNRLSRQLVTFMRRQVNKTHTAKGMQMLVFRILTIKTKIRRVKI